MKRQAVRHSANFRSGEWGARRVAERHENVYEGPLLTVTTDAGTVRTTVYHPFWVAAGRDLDERSVPRELSPEEDQGLSLDGRWVNSHELRVGDLLIGQDGRPRTVLKIEQQYQTAFPVNNLTIDKDHTFAVGPDAVLVHNTSKCDDLADAAQSATKLPWKRTAARKAAKAIEEGSTTITVPSRDDASEVVWRMFSSRGFTNTTGRTGSDVRTIIGSKARTYHWDEVLDTSGNVVGHGADNLHNAMRHVQVHFETGEILRIFFP